MKERTITLEYAAFEDDHGIIDGLGLARELIADAQKLVLSYAGPDAPCSEIFEILMSDAFAENVARGVSPRLIATNPGAADLAKRERDHFRDMQRHVAALLKKGRAASARYWAGL
ncbi:hypothetical protein [Aliihoeflea sp. 40Bstr573]|uniref:hypothetical protein n=1 Tax=Aliihoeflea sp. 40Bstr573 TaxID=2696467 RepID=UPI002096149C|nr:hypothetical protein [Aliihoeflea sp. 40Bstr573]MCO6388248.1 hypothetical protein [Aliihoeflea sp. 40Bstr573]